MFNVFRLHSLVVRTCHHSLPPFLLYWDSNCGSAHTVIVLQSEGFWFDSPSPQSICQRVLEQDTELHTLLSVYGLHSRHLRWCVNMTDHVKHFGLWLFNHLILHYIYKSPLMHSSSLPG